MREFIIDYLANGVKQLVAIEDGDLIVTGVKLVTRDDPEFETAVMQALEIEKLVLTSRDRHRAAVLLEDLK